MWALTPMQISMRTRFVVKLNGRTQRSRVHGMQMRKKWKSPQREAAWERATAINHQFIGYAIIFGHSMLAMRLTHRLLVSNRRHENIAFTMRRNAWIFDLTNSFGHINPKSMSVHSSRIATSNQSKSNDTERYVSHFDKSTPAYRILLNDLWVSMTHTRTANAQCAETEREKNERGLLSIYANRWARWTCATNDIRIRTKGFGLWNGQFMCARTKTKQKKVFFCLFVCGRSADEECSVDIAPRV